MRPASICRPSGLNSFSTSPLGTSSDLTSTCEGSSGAAHAWICHSSATTFGSSISTRSTAATRRTGLLRTSQAGSAAAMCAAQQKQVSETAIPSLFFQTQLTFPRHDTRNIIHPSPAGLWPAPSLERSSTCTVPQVYVFIQENSGFLLRLNSCFAKILSLWTSSEVPA